MSRTFTDKDLLVWEAYPSCGAFGFPEDPQIVFNCLSNRMLRPRRVKFTGDEADAERAVNQASQTALLELFEQAHDIS